MPAPLDEQPGLLQVAALAGHPVQLDQGRLDLRVAADRLNPVRPERRADVVGGPADGTDEVVRPGRPGPGDPGLDEVPEGVQLVAPLQVAVARRLAGPAEVGVEVAVGFLGGDDPGRDALEPGVDLGVLRAPVLPGEGLEQLVDLGVGELPTPAGVGQASGHGGVEVAQPALALQPVLDVGQRARRGCATAAGRESRR